MKCLSRTTATFVIAALGVSGHASGQGFFGGSPDSSQSKDSILIRNVVADAAKDVAESTVLLRVTEDGEAVDAAYGLVLDATGLLATKASEMDDTLFADLLPTEDGGEVAAQIVAIDADHDVALVQLDLPDDLQLRPFVFEPEAVVIGEPEAGTWLVSVDADPDGVGGDVPTPVATGVISITGFRQIEPSQQRLGIQLGPDGRGGIPVVSVRRGGRAFAAGLRPGDLIVSIDGRDVLTRRALTSAIARTRPGGVIRLRVIRDFERVRGPNGFTVLQDRLVDVPVRLDGGQIGMTIADRVTGVTVARPQFGSPAAAAGLMPGDLITRVDDQVVGTNQELIELLQGVRAGERVTVAYIRKGVPAEVEIQVGDSGRGDRARFQNAMGGATLNRRSTDFEQVIQHDTVLPANRMGGPVIDLRGRLVGMNIARAGRVETYALPAGTLFEVVEGLRKSVGQISEE
jgi:S1-C subfamily serine protease